MMNDSLATIREVMAGILTMAYLVMAAIPIIEIIITVIGVDEAVGPIRIEIVVAITEVRHAIVKAKYMDN